MRTTAEKSFIELKEVELIICRVDDYNEALRQLPLPLHQSLLHRMFFDACDGFFTNYNWTETNLEWMKVFSGIQGRQADVYIGVDVFGRGEVVGGMFETNKVMLCGLSWLIVVIGQIGDRFWIWFPGSGSDSEAQLLCSHLRSGLGV